MIFEINDHAKQYMSDEFEFCKGLVGVIQLGHRELKLDGAIGHFAEPL